MRFDPKRLWFKGNGLNAATQVGIILIGIYSNYYIYIQMNERNV